MERRRLAQVLGAIAYMSSVHLPHRRAARMLRGPEPPRCDRKPHLALGPLGQLSLVCPISTGKIPGLAPRRARDADEPVYDRLEPVMSADVPCRTRRRAAGCLHGSSRKVDEISVSGRVPLGELDGYAAGTPY